MTNESLKPCPFCGEKAEIETNEDGSKVHVVCSLCYARTDDYYLDYSDYAIQDWNRRTPANNTNSDELLSALAKLLTAMREVAVLIEP